MGRSLFVVFSFFFIFAYANQIEMLQKSCNKVDSTVYNKAHSAACYELGLLHEEGIGFDQNITQAKKYYFKACNQNIDQACLALDRIENNK